jgi:transposase InsO family protein|tara:strand:+ start:144 stop:1139 length:996 start_codon:yes stop_codon:yes gene_type:complete
MTSDTQIYKDRLYIIKYYLKNKTSVTKLCKQVNRSRTWFYKWFNRYKLYGSEGLHNIIRELPAMPNQTPVDIEMKILDFIEEYPSYGPVRISNELKKSGIIVKPSAVYNVLKRHYLNRRKLRLEHIRIKYNVVKDKSDLERAKELSKTRSLITKHPGDVIGMDVFYVGCLKSIGRIYQYTAIDTYSSFSWTKLYTDKGALAACDFMMHVRNNSLDIPVKSVLTDNGKEFTTHHKSKKHSFERLLNELNIKHRLTKVRHPWTNGSVERFQRTILEEFYQVTFRKKIYITLDELNDNLNKYIDHYNFKRTHQGKRTNGRVPAELYLLNNNSAA